MAHELNPLEQSPKDKQFLVEAADLVKNKMPEGYGFVVFAFPLNRTGRIFYISNAQRAGIVTALRKWLDHAEQDFGKHT